MSEYQAPLRDMQFAINELAGLESLTGLAGFEETCITVLLVTFLKNTLGHKCAIDHN